MTEPTDAEIADMARKAGLLPDNSHPAPETRATRRQTDAVQAFARAVLTKWGTPPVVAGEPVAYRHMHDDGWEYYDAPTGSDCPGCEPLYATPQPTQAQAGAVPLTPEKIAEIADAAHREYDRLVASGQCAPRWSAVFAHFLEQHHGIGIKGGQHGESV